MKKITIACLSVIGFSLFQSGIIRAADKELSISKIEEITGLKAAFSKDENVCKVTFPRSDVKVMVDNWQMPPFMGLGCWAAFTPGQKAEAMVMGDTVLFGDEVNPVMSVALNSGLQVTALHNHFFFDDPKVYFMHIEGEGDLEKLAGAVRKMYDKIKEIRAASAKPRDGFGGKPMPETNNITSAPLNAVFGSNGDVKNGMVKFTIGRTTTMPCGCVAGKDMGVNTWAAFAGSDDNAVVDGDFAVAENELQTVLKTLRNGDINIVAIHSHMTSETPRILFLHYWGRGVAETLAKTLKSALQTQGK